MSSGDELGKEELSTGEVNRALTEFVWFVVRCALLLYPVYLCGALGLSVSWILLTVLLWRLWEKNRRRKGERVGAAIDFVENECHVIKSEMTKALNSPSWVSKTRGRGKWLVLQGGQVRPSDFLWGANLVWCEIPTHMHRNVSGRHCGAMVSAVASR